MARVSGNLQRGLASARDFVQDPVQAPEPVNRVDQARQLAGRGRNEVAPSLAAAAGAGFVFGPVGALLAGWAVHQTHKKNRERLQAAAGALAANKVESLDKARASLTGALEAAETDQDRAEIKADLDAFDAYATAAFSPDPSIATGAFAKALETSGALQDLLDDQQQELLDREQRVQDEFQVEVGRFQSLADDYRTETGNYINLQTNFGNLKSSLMAGTGAGDIAAVTGYMKMLDPASTVREGEFATAENAGGVDSGIRNLYNRLLTGERLGAAERRDFLDRATEFMDIATQRQMEVNTRYMEQGRAQKIRPELLDTLFVNPRELRAKEIETPDKYGRTTVAPDQVPPNARQVQITEDRTTMLPRLFNDAARFYTEQFSMGAQEAKNSDIFYDRETDSWFQTDRDQGETYRLPGPPLGYQVPQYRVGPAKGLPGPIYPIERNTGRPKND